MLISEYCGGGFGSKGAGAISMVIPALLSKKAGAPVMMRISREEELYIGRARTGMVGRAKAGFSKDGRITALDLFIVEDNGPYGPMGDYRSAANAASLIWQPLAMRWRGVAVVTNTPPRSQQRSPGPMQANAIMEPVVTKAAKKLGLDQLAIRRINSPEGKAPYGPPRPNGQRGHVTSAFVKQALDRGAELFKWDERKARSGKREGTKVRGIGVAVGPHGAGSIGYDGLMTIRPDGRLYVQSGVGNLGTHSCIDLARVAADVLAMPWDKVVVNWGSTAKNIPWSAMSVGSQTTHAMTRANLAGAVDARLKLQEIAAKDLGGAPADYALGNERVYRRDNPSRGLSYAQAAERAIALGGKYDGHELPDDIHAMTKKSATALAGLGLMGVAKDTYPRDGDTYSFVAGFAEVEVDLETGEHAAGRLPGRCGCRHRGQPAQPPRPDSRRHQPGHRSRAAAEVRLRPAVRRGARETLSPQQAADDSRHPAGDAHRGGRPRGSGNASRRARRRRAAGRRRLRIGDERDCRRGGGRGVPARAGHGRHRADVIGAWEADARAARVPRLKLRE